MTIDIPIALPASAELARILLNGEDRAILVETPELLVGVKRFEAGEVFRNHFHENYDEYFVGLTGEETVWQGRALSTQLVPGASILCMRGSHHALVNTSTGPATVLFVKAGVIAVDTTWVPFAQADTASSAGAAS